MGQKQSTETNKYQLSFLLKKNNKFINIKSYEINKALNVFYVYFKINDYSLNYIINSDVEIYISNLNKDYSSNLITEDILRDKIKNTTNINNINNEQYYDIIHTTEKSKKLIFRTKDVYKKSFTIVYII